MNTKDDLLDQIDAAIQAAQECKKATPQKMFCLFQSGGTSYRVLNTKERLTEFSSEVDRCSGFKTHIPKKWRQAKVKTTPTPASDRVIREMLEGGDALSAYTLAQLAGKPLVFGVSRKAIKINPYTEALRVEVKGFEGFDMVSARWIPTGMRITDSWSVLLLTSGEMITSTHFKREGAEGEARRILSKLTSEDLCALNEIGQEALAQQWLNQEEEV